MLDRMRTWFRTLAGIAAWLLYAVIGAGWCFGCRHRLWIGARPVILPIFCPRCHAVLLPSRWRRLGFRDFAPRPPAAPVESVAP